MRPRFLTRSNELARVAVAPTASTTTSAPSPSVNFARRSRATGGSAGSAPLARAKSRRSMLGSTTTTAAAPTACAARLVSWPTAPPPITATISPASRRARSMAAQPVARLSLTRIAASSLTPFGTFASVVSANGARTISAWAPESGGPNDAPVPKNDRSGHSQWSPLSHHRHRPHAEKSEATT